jgi:diguanylate cyclase (GGDEF)-like protein
MPSRSALRPTGVLCCWLLLAGALAGHGAAGDAERGFPLIQTYDTVSREGESQNFGIARDPQGLLYPANLNGVLVYDGAWWRQVPIGKARAAFSVASDAKGRVAAGGVDDFGVLAPDDHGALRFSSLLSLLPPSQRELGQVMQVAPTADGFLFATAQRLLAWDGSRITTLATFPGDRPFATIFKVGTEIYLWKRDGLSRITGTRGTRIEPVPGGAVFAGRRVDTILPADHGLLVSVRGEGLFLFDPSGPGKAVPFAPEASRWTAAKRLTPSSGCRLPDGRWALGSILGGLLLLRPDGGMDQVVDSTVGLPDDFVNGVALDREGSLWLALNNGVAKVEVASPVSVIDRRAGLQGSVYDLARHRGDLWVATAAGLFTVDHSEEARPDLGRPVRLRAVPGLPPSAWSLLSMGDDLLVGTAFGLYRVARDGTAEQVPGAGQQTIYVLTRSKADPQRVWMGGEDGLSAVRRDGSGWRFEGRIEAVHHEVRSIVEGEGGVVWCGLPRNGVIGAEVAPGPGPLRVLGTRPVAGSDGMTLSWIDGRILAARGGRLLRLDEAHGTLAEDPATAGLHAGADRFVEDAAGNLWISSRPPAVALRRGNGWSPELRSLLEVPVRTVESILAEPDGMVWLGADNGLFRYAGSFRATAAPLPAPLLSRVTLGAETLVFGGAPGVVPPPAALPHNVRHLRIEIGPLSFRPGLRYQTRIDPLDADWSHPTADPFAEMTRLPPGGYTFRARTIGPNGEVGPETAWPFRVRPPWYLTHWALALWMLAAVLLMIGYSWLRSRALHHRAARLEARVAEQTLELRRTVEELSHAHSELEVANERLEELSLRDDLTGIANRRRLQQMLEEEWVRARRYQRPLAFILLDLDHFKLLNDTRGHREGDTCLQAVAHYLAEALRRTSDLVARYGGEEFAVLLSGTDLAGALKMAEQLRQGVEGLALSHEAVPTGRVTASFGVAAMVPAPGESPGILVEAADLALYRAKTAGRNRVVAGG